MKILFIGDYSGLHTTLAAELRRLGHHVTVVSDRCGCMDTDTDIYLARRKGPFSGFNYLYKVMKLWPRLAGYDVVQLVNPHFLCLRPGKLMYFFKELRRANGGVFLSLAGNDHFFVKECVKGEMFRFSEFRVGKNPTKFSLRDGEHEAGYLLPSVARFTGEIYSMIDGAMSVLPEYDMAARPVLGDKLAFTNLPVNLAELAPAPFDTGAKIRILVGMRSELILSKGTDDLLNAALEVEKMMPDRVEVVNVRDLPWPRYLECLRGAHIVLDQLYSYSPGMNALDTMALGRISGSGAQPEYYEYLGETELRPIVELSPLRGDIAGDLCALVNDPGRMELMARQGRRLVEKYNDVKLVTGKYLAHWKKLSR